MKLPIRSKITLAAVLTVSLVAGLSGLMLNAQQSLAALMNEMVEKNMAAMRLAEQIKYNFVLYDDLVFRYLFTDDKMLIEEGLRVRDRVHGAIRQMKALVGGRTEQELLAEIEEDTTRYEADVRLLLDTYAFKTADQKKGVLDLIKSLESGAASEAVNVKRSQRQTLNLLSADGRARLVRIYSQCEKLVDISRSKLEDAQERVTLTVEKAQRAALLAGAAAAAAALAVSLLLGASLLAPLRNLLKGVQRVTAGELDLELPVDGGDEVGRLTQEFNSMTRNLREKQERLLKETITDSLTELHNFRFFQTRLKEEISRAARYKRSLALLVIDIDHFKHYNDTNGHQMGNVLLKQLAGALRETLRREDFLARYGGEEFVVILPETDKSSAEVVAERLRQSVELSDFPSGKTQPGGRLTVTVGGAVFPVDGQVPERLIEAADQALYAAKKAGRNRVFWAPPLPARASA